MSLTIADIADFVFVKLVYRITSLMLWSVYIEKKYAELFESRKHDAKFKGMTGPVLPL
ncbi:MAG: hypothetical protein ACI4ND_01785 [Succinivibrio sp.]